MFQGLCPLFSGGEVLSNGDGQVIPGPRSVGLQGPRVVELASTQTRLLRPSEAPTAVRGIRVAAILLAPPHPTSKGAACPLAGRGLRARPAELGQGSGQPARSGLRDAAAIGAKVGVGVGVGVGRASRLLHSLRLAGGRLRRGRWVSAGQSPRPVPGPPSAPAGLRPGGLEGPGRDGRAALLTSLSAGTDLAVLFAGERRAAPEVPSRRNPRAEVPGLKRSGKGEGQGKRHVGPSSWLTFCNGYL
ncbi:uncharacterized protein LOC116641920 [Phoca vitulina]|uniref:uncharacterized protein LOC116641920 n=1 Tax=Phoca vitulina TaxID=9720 RepID=UPI0013963D4B|nr:uncharacterized protein LOC116641920 [Phoca vitulina]